MIAERLFHYPKPGRLIELRDLIQTEMQRFSSPLLHAGRLYSHDIGCSSPISVEFEFESHSEREKYWADWQADPGTPAFMEKYMEMIGHFWKDETWVLEE